MEIDFNNLPKVVGVMHDMLFEIKKQLIPTKSSNSVTTPAMLVNSKQCCDYLKISLPTLNRWKSKGKVSYIKLGGSIRYDLNTVTKELEVNRRAKS
jgi:hypothetical protein